MTLLWDKLYKSRITCPISETKFLSVSFLKENITEEVVQTQIPLRSWVPKVFCPDRVPNLVACKAFKVFAVLVLIEEEQAIRKLVSTDQITDDDLPLDHGDNNILLSVSTGRRFPAFRPWSNAKRQAFLDTQWVVLAPVFSTIGRHILLDDRCPLPFVPCGARKSQRGIAYTKVDDAGSNCVVVYRAQLEESHRIGKFASYEKIAVKELVDEATFDKEKKNLEQVQELANKHLIKFLGSCERGSVYYFMFPWADGGDLRRFWKDSDGILRTKQLISWILQQNLGVVGAIKALHKKNMRHGDIKPQNILHFRGPLGNDGTRFGTLVLADVGISKRHDQATIHRVEGTNTAEVTVLYEAPEAESDRRLKRPRSRKYDIWSLGCMLLEFIVWFVYGFEAVETFRHRRSASSRDPTSAPGNFFTEPSTGVVELHSQVLEAIAHLRTDPRCENDTALDELITLIQQRLLRTNPDDRSEALEVYERFLRIVEAAHANPSYLFRQVEPTPDTPDFFRPRNTSLPIQTPTAPSSSSSSLESTCSENLCSGVESTSSESSSNEC